jgi:hypothetical protein
MKTRKVPESPTVGSMPSVRDTGQQPLVSSTGGQASRQGTPAAPGTPANARTAPSDALDVVLAMSVKKPSKRAPALRSVLAGGAGSTNSSPEKRVNPETLPSDQRKLLALLNRARNRLLTGKISAVNSGLMRELETFLGEKKPAHRPRAEGYKANVIISVDHLLGLGIKKAEAFRVVARILSRSPEAIKSVYKKKGKNS